MMPFMWEFAFYAKWPKPGKLLPNLLTACHPQHATPELRIFCPDDEKFGVIKQIANYVSMKTSSTNVTLIDGVRVRFDDGWWWLASLEH